MSPIHRTIMAAVWGVPAPVVAGVVIVIVIQRSAIAAYANGETTWVQLADDMAKWWPIPVIEAVIGLVYGFLRRNHIARDRNWRSLELLEGFLIGGFTWLILASPVLLCGIGSVFALIIAGMSTWSNMALFLGLVAIHIFGGAIAGFHVEHYLLRTEPPNRE